MYYSEVHERLSHESNCKLTGKFFDEKLNGQDKNEISSFGQSTNCVCSS